MRRFNSVTRSIVRTFEDIFFPSVPKGKLGASLNIFDGEELLLDLVSSIRKEVDYISVVFQEKGHWGDLKAEPHLKYFLQELLEIGLIDEFLEWSPPNSATNQYSFNEMDVEKRNIGLNLARENGCTHYIILDNDEFYSQKQFRYMKRIMMDSKSKWDYSVVRHLQYYKNTNHIKKVREEEYVMVIFPIRQSTKLVHEVQSQFPIDPGRKIQGKHILEFSRFEVCMHHLSYLRKDIGKKLMTSHARLGNVESFDQIISRYENFQYPQRGLWAHGVEIELKQIRPRIKLKYYEADAYSQFVKGISLQELLLEIDN
jgi:hypothetical protein